jgi:hypothetical protein
VQINFEKACFASFFKIYLGFEKAQSAVKVRLSMAKRRLATKENQYIA